MYISCGIESDDDVKIVFNKSNSHPHTCVGGAGCGNPRSLYTVKVWRKSCGRARSQVHFEFDTLALVDPRAESLTVGACKQQNTPVATIFSSRLPSFRNMPIGLFKKRKLLHPVALNTTQLVQHGGGCTVAGSSKKRESSESFEQASASLSQREINISQIERGEARVVKQPFLPIFLNVQQKLRAPFKSPCEHLRTEKSIQLLREKRLGTGGRGLKRVSNGTKIVSCGSTSASTRPSLYQFDDPTKRLVLYERNGKILVEVPAVLAKVLRNHQREGVSFMFDCVSGLSLPPFSGCILADDMGLGKTLQTIALIYTLISCSFELEPFSPPLTSSSLHKQQQDQGVLNEFVTPNREWAKSSSADIEHLIEDDEDEAFEAPGRKRIKVKVSSSSLDNPVNVVYKVEKYDDGNWAAGKFRSSPIDLSETSLLLGLVSQSTKTSKYCVQFSPKSSEPKWCEPMIFQKITKRNPGGLLLCTTQRDIKAALSAAKEAFKKTNEEPPDTRPTPAVVGCAKAGGGVSANAEGEVQTSSIPQKYASDVSLSKAIMRKIDVKKVIIICPTSLVRNWINEFQKWLGDALACIAVDGASQKEKLKQIRRFSCDRKGVYQVLVISYETYRIYSDEFKGKNMCDLLVCDEAHRLKNDQTRVNRAINMLNCDRRILLSGTPMQNDLDEFFVMANFCMLRRFRALPSRVEDLPDEVIFGSQTRFRKYFAVPLLAGREPDATELEIKISGERQLELSILTSKFIIRRTNELNKVHLPNKLTMVVCCSPSEMQMNLYEYLTRPDNLNREKSKFSVLSAITTLKKLVNHPYLLIRMMQQRQEQYSKDRFMDGLSDLYDPMFFDKRNRRECELACHSGKMHVLSQMMHHLFEENEEKMVLVSNYTETLDIFEKMCRELGARYVRLDGGVTVRKRQTLVDRFNDKNQGIFAFLLSSKAGGCGLNLIGASRLVLFDPSWNPADDAQAAARIWRDGQTRKCYIYRFLAAGTIEEKIFQRQLSKEGLQSMVMTNENEEDDSGHVKQSTMSTEEIRQLFQLRKTASDTHDMLRCTGCQAKQRIWKLHPRTAGYKEESKDSSETDLSTWAHHARVDTVDDPLLKQCFLNGNNDGIKGNGSTADASGKISFIFSYEVMNSKN